MNQQKACHIRFNTAANKLEQLPYSIFKAPTLEKLIYPLSIVTQYDRKNLCHHYKDIHNIKDLSFDNFFKEDYESIYYDFLSYHLDPTSSFYKDPIETSLIHFIYFHPCLPSDFGFAQDVCIPPTKYVNSVYYFNTILADYNKRVTFDLILDLVNEQVPLANPFYMETSVVNFSVVTPEGETYADPISDFAYYGLNRELNIELDSGDTVAPFIMGVNYFSNEIWDKLGSKRTNIIEQYCKIIPFADGIVASLKEGELSDLLENLEVINKINTSCGFGNIEKYEDRSSYDCVFQVRVVEEEYDFEDDEFS
jgi:hypothetical protein